MKSKLVYVVPGWSEGSWHLRRLRRHLPQIGYRLTQSPKNADIIIAHSAGAYSLPESPATLILVLNPPYWPGRPIITRVWQNIILDLPKEVRLWGAKRLLAIRVQNTINVLRRPVWHIKLWAALGGQLLSDNRGRNIIVVRNNQDAFSTPELKDYCAKLGVRYVEMDGLHEDIWFNPRPYLELIEKHYGR